MDEDIELDDLISFYPPSFEPEIQKKISAKKEFNELSSNPKETLKKARGDYFKHQKFIQRFLQHYNELILFHETATGKSCAITATADILKKEHESTDTNSFLSGGYIERAIVIVNNKQLKTRMIDEIVCKCTDGVYDTPEAEASIKKVYRNVRQWYTVKERESFARKLAKISNQEIIERYSNSIIFIDEAHNLRFRTFKGEPERKERPDIKLKRHMLNRFLVQGLKDLANTYDIAISGRKDEIIDQLLDDPSLSLKKINKAIDSGKYALSKTEKDRKKPKFGKEDIYVQFWRLFQVARNTKKVLATATPMVNDSSEIKDLLNLILPSRISPYDENFPKFTKKVTTTQLGQLLYISPNTKIKDMTNQQLEKLFRGKVSYVRRLDTGIDIQYQGIPIYKIQGYHHAPKDYETETKVYLGKMSDFQSKIYRQVRKGKQNELRNKERQVSNFVYPDGSFGLKGFNKYISQIGHRYRVKTETASGREFAKQISTIDGIRNLGVKFAEIIEIANSVKGNIFVYSNYSKASGAVPFAMCLEAQGYELFDEPDMNSVFRLKNITNVQTYCTNGAGERVIRESFAKKPIYAFLSPDITTSSLEVLLSLMNSPENKHGEYIKIFITTPVGGEGISLNNVISIHLIDGDWKHATNYQAESRAIRSTSHVELLKEQSRVEVKIFNHAAYTCEPSEEGTSTLEMDDDYIYPCENNKLLSIDIRLYERS